MHGVTKDYYLTTTEWSPAILAAAEALYNRLRLTHSEWPKWSKLAEIDEDAFDHYCIAARNTVFAFHNQAAKSEEVKVDPNYGQMSSAKSS